jgi:hypothetical protein
MEEPVEAALQLRLSSDDTTPTGTGPPIDKGQERFLRQEVVTKYCAFLLQQERQIEHDLIAELNPSPAHLESRIPLRPKP